MTELKIVENKPEDTEQLIWKVNDVVMNDIIGRLFKAHVIKEPQMKFIYNDRGILETLFDAHMKDEQVELLKQAKPDTYLMVMAVHGMGAGMMTIFKQNEKGKSLGHFSDEEVYDLNNLYKAYDVYQLACQVMEIEPGSDKKKYLDTVANQGAFLAKRTVGDKIFEDEVMFGFVQTMFNLGVTIALG